MDYMIRPFKLSDVTAIIALWRECGLTHPNNDPYKDLSRKMKVNPEMFLVCELDGRIVGTVMAPSVSTGY